MIEIGSGAASVASLNRLQWQGLDVDAADALRDLITTAKLFAGQHLREIELSERLGVSRGTLRVAFKQLAHEGLVEYRPGRGVFVSGFHAQDAWEIYTLRNTLEAMAATLAAEKINADGLRRLDEAIKELRRASVKGDRTALGDSERRFHRLVVKLAGHARLTSAYDILDLQTRTFVARTLTDAFHPDLGEVLRLHTELADAIRSGDTARAQSLAASHNTRDGERLVRELAEAL